jgi:hypothetical protein
MIINLLTHIGIVWFFAFLWWRASTTTVATTDSVHIHITVEKYVTIVGKAVELAGIIPEINKLNITIDRRIVISTIQNKIENLST